MWRLSWEPTPPEYAEQTGTVSSLLAAACMHGGCRVLLASHPGGAQGAGTIKERVESGDPEPGASSSTTDSFGRCSLTVTHSFESHTSLAYGIDWLRSVPRKDVVSLSDSADERSVAEFGGDGAGVAADAATVSPACTPNNGSKGLISCSFYDRSVFIWRLDAAHATA